MLRTISLAMLLFSFSHKSFALTWEQMVELYREGTITVRDAEGQPLGNFSVHFMPGSRNIYNYASKHWSMGITAMSEPLKNPSSYFYQHSYSPVKAIYTACSHEIAYRGIGAIPKDASQLMKNCSEATGQFGETAIKALNVMAFTFAVASRTMLTAVVAGCGTALSVIVPVALPLVIPTKGLVGDVAILGTGVPTVGIVWNSIAWLLSAWTNEPKHDKKMLLITWRPYQNVGGFLAEE